MYKISYGFVLNYQRITFDIICRMIPVLVRNFIPFTSET